MPTIPSELISLLGSSVLGGVMKVWSRSNEIRLYERMIALQHLHSPSAPPGDFFKSRFSGGRSFQWTRKFIALIAVFFIIAFPKIVAVWMPQAVHIGYQQLSQGFLFFSDIEKIKWVQMKGLVISPLDTHILAAIVGLYFGDVVSSH
ncbi:MAG: hypothetical protein A2007_05065 [Verrucomicrobia bacterium GWC2_42_7]|nr:MAG: hypothetical protein A2007_05065 [Verrucomicrobia bacterium GWC2_42_7]